MARSLAFALAAFVTAASPLVAQWTPTGLLAGVPVSEDCERSAGAPAYAAEGPQIFTCESAAEAIEAELAHASAFFVVHEYGRIAAEGGTESQADCWAASELGATPDGMLYVDAVARWFEAHGGEFVERLGTGAERASRIRECSGLPFAPPPTSDTCCTASGSCHVTETGAALPLGTWCYCVLDESTEQSTGEVCASSGAVNPA